MSKLQNPKSKLQGSSKSQAPKHAMAALDGPVAASRKSAADFSDRKNAALLRDAATGAARSTAMSQFQISLARAWNLVFGVFAIVLGAWWIVCLEGCAIGP